eukprot:6189805-Pleurochrysis_carterae.AAC.3
MLSQQAAFDKAVGELAYRVANFQQHTELARVLKVVSIVDDIKAALKDFEAKAQANRVPRLGSALHRRTGFT